MVIAMVFAEVCTMGSGQSKAGMTVKMTRGRFPLHNIRERI